MANKNLILVSGKSTTGKSMCLRNLPNPEGVVYMNCENGKELPFPCSFKEVIVTDPYQVYKIIAYAESQKNIHTLVIDSLTYLMDLFESVYVIPSEDSRGAWGDYAQFLRNLMAQYVAKSTKNIIFLAHTSNVYNENELVTECIVKVKGATMNIGVESFFTNVISTKRINIKDLPYENEYLHITEDEKEDGYKYVFQTRLTKETINERIRPPYKMWSREETYIDNDIMYVLERLQQYYSKSP